MTDYRSLSLWLEDSGDDLAPRSPLGSDLDVDVAVVGGGYTGLWTAYYLARADPSLRIAVLEKEICGFGASGRNGGWCSALFAGSRRRTEKRLGRAAAIELQRAMFDTVDEVGRACADEGIDARFRKSGSLTFATAPAHVERVKQAVDEEHSWGFEDDYGWLTVAEAAARIRIAGCMGAAFTPHCARVQPARLARGLARVVEGLGVQVFEGTEVVDLGNGWARAPGGRVRAEVIVCATEAYTARLPGMRRRLVPLYSLMIATEQLPRAFWDEVGWSGFETFSDGRHLLIYAQRTDDDRIALGGRGAPYHFASRIERAYDREPRVFEELERVLKHLFPEARAVRVTHSWGGPLGVPRDWYSSVRFDRARGLAWAGGYVGDGVSTANLAGRTLRDLILGNATDLTRLAWVGHRSRRWEPEPLRWIGANLALRAMASADDAEARTGRPARRADAVTRLIGF